MSITGKSSKSLVKQDLLSDKSAIITVKKVMFQHQATAGATQIDLSALVLPAEAAANGFVQPSASVLAGLNLQANYKNLLLFSLASNTILAPYISYTVSGNKINLVEAAVDGEIFIGIVDPVIRSDSLVADVDFILASGTLLAGQTDINVGKSFKANLNPDMKMGAVAVIVEGQTLTRNVGNATTGDDYQEVPDAGGASSSLIRLNSTSGVDRKYHVVSTAASIIRPDGSLNDELERLQGIMDKVVEVLAVVSGLDETDFQAIPSQQQLKQFGDRVIALETNRARIDTGNVWTAVQALIGRTDASVVPSGQIGEVITLYTDLNLRTAGNTQNAYMDVPAAAFNIPAGNWMVICQAVMQIDFVTGGGAGDGLIGSIAIRTSGGTVVAETQMATANLNLQRAFGNTPVVGFVNINATGAYKLSAYLKTISGAVSVTNALIRGDFANLPTKVVAVRIA